MRSRHGVCLDSMKTFTQRARASLERAEAAPNIFVKRDQLHIAEAQLQCAERYEGTSINNKLEINDLILWHHNLKETVE